jgi:hypothetical protein
MVNGAHEPSTIGTVSVNGKPDWLGVLPLYSHEPAVIPTMVGVTVTLPWD